MKVYRVALLAGSITALTVAVTAPVIAAEQTAGQMKHAAAQTSDTRMQVLAGATTALAAKNAADAIGADPKTGGGINIATTVGTTASRSKTTEDAVHAAVKAHGLRLRHREGTAKSGWLLLDCGDVVVHVFLEEPRAFYALERLWGDAPMISVEG